MDAVAGITDVHYVYACTKHDHAPGGGAGGSAASTGGGVQCSNDGGAAGGGVADGAGGGSGESTGCHDSGEDGLGGDVAALTLGVGHALVPH